MRNTGSHDLHSAIASSSLNSSITVLIITYNACFNEGTMASAVEALGMVVPGTASHPAVTPENEVTEQKKIDCKNTVTTLFAMLKSGQQEWLFV